MRLYFYSQAVDESGVTR
ncbi:hypothetical protein J7F94_002766 [Escherichia coli]|nr:hypothetical protein [Escherichia coli]HCU1393399.1 hypothetical protein [Escherichia coli]